MPLVRAVLVAALALMPAASLADAGLRQLEARDAGLGFGAVGRLEVGERSFCTGTLIAPQIVLTAAHCLIDRVTGERFEATDATFLAGWRDGRARASRRGRNAVTHFAYDAEDDTLENLALDIALIELDSPIVDAEIAALSSHSALSPGDAVAVVSYAHDRADAPRLQEVCHVLGVRKGASLMNCEADFGSSGSPVLRLGAGRPEVVSVISAKAEMQGRPLSIGADISAPLDVLMEDLSRSGGAFRLPPAYIGPPGDGARGIGGAKFVRP